MSRVKIFNHYLDEINWTSAAGCCFVAGNHIDVWRINISSNLSSLNGFLSIMHSDEIARANRYHQLKDKNRYIVSRGALRIILAKYLEQQPSSITFKTGANKKPYVVSAKPAIHYNISHSGDWILLAVSNSEIGADTEFIDPDFDYSDIIADNFSDEEINYIKEEAPALRFYMLWTRKEALTKATGNGLDDNLKLIPCLNGTNFVQSEVIASAINWSIASFKLNEQYIASIAGNEGISAIRFWEAEF